MAGSELTPEAPADQGLCSAQQKRRRTDGGGSRKVIPETPAGPSIGATSGPGEGRSQPPAPRSASVTVTEPWLGAERRNREMPPLPRAAGTGGGGQHEMALQAGPRRTLS